MGMQYHSKFKLFIGRIYKRWLAKFNGVSVNFELHLKESEWRWKKQPDELASEL